MWLDLWIYENHEELVEHPNRDEIMFLLWDDFSDELLDSMSDDGKRITMKQLENRLDYDVNSLLTDEKLIFYLGGQPVWYIKIEAEEEDNTINLHTLITSNNNNATRDIPLPKYIDTSVDSKYLIIGKKLPYLGTTMIKILVEEFCNKEGIECINITSAEWANGFYEKTLKFLEAEMIINNYKQTWNEFNIYL